MKNGEKSKVALIVAIGENLHTYVIRDADLEPVSPDGVRDTSGGRP